MILTPPSGWQFSMWTVRPMNMLEPGVFLNRFLKGRYRSPQNEWINEWWSKSQNPQIHVKWMWKLLKMSV